MSCYSMCNLQNLLSLLMKRYNDNLQGSAAIMKLTDGAIKSLITIQCKFFNMQICKLQRFIKYTSFPDFTASHSNYYYPAFKFN